MALYKHLGGDVARLPEYFVTALEISAKAHTTWSRPSPLTWTLPSPRR